MRTRENKKRLKGVERMDLPGDRESQKDKENGEENKTASFLAVFLAHRVGGGFSRR